MLLKRLCNNTAGLVIKKYNTFVNFGPLSTFATKMRQGVTKNKKDSAGRRLGVKKYGGEEVRENQILIRQRGLRWKAGENVHVGKDQTIHASKEGKVTFTQDPWSKKRRVFVHVVEQEIPNRKLNLPRPFMYHPELYPELAQKNIKAEPLVIKPDLTVQAKKEQTLRKKSLKAANKEITILGNENKFENQGESQEEGKSALSLRKIILQSAKAAEKIKASNFTSKFQVEPILNEIAEIGVKYFIPDHNAEKEKFLQRARYAYQAEQRGENPNPLGLFPYDKQFSLNEYDHINSLGADSYGKLQELFTKFVKQEKETKPLPLRDLLASLKKENLLDESLDIRSVPYEAKLESDQKVYKNELIREKIYLEGVLKNLVNMKEEDLSELYEEYEVNSKNELGSLMKNDLEAVNYEITQKFLRLNMSNYGGNEKQQIKGEQKTKNGYKEYIK